MLPPMNWSMTGVEPRSRVALAALVVLASCIVPIFASCGGDKIDDPPGYSVEHDAASTPDTGAEAPSPECPGIAPTKADLAGSGLWHSPRPHAPACSANEVARFKQNFTPSSTATDLVAGLSPTCSSCLLSDASDTTWGPIVVTDESATDYFLDYGACYAIVSGSEACAQASQYEDFCVDYTCATCSAFDLDACRGDAITLNACESTFGADVTANCSASHAALFAQCGDPAQLAAVTCGGSTPDASTDAPSDGSSDAPLDSPDDGG